MIFVQRIVGSIWGKIHFFVIFTLLYYSLIPTYYRTILTGQSQERQMRHLADLITHLHHQWGTLLLLFMTTCSLSCSHSLLVQALRQHKAFSTNKAFITYIVSLTIIESVEYF